MVRKRSGFYPVVRVDAAGSGVVSRAGGITLAEMVRVVGLDWALSGALTPWRKPTAVHDPAKVVCDLALMLAMGGLPGRHRPAAGGAGGVRAGGLSSDGVPHGRRAGRGCAPGAGGDRRGPDAGAGGPWRLAGRQAPDHGVDGTRPLVIDVDATLVTAHPEKEQAAPTFKRGYGFHPL